MPLSWFETLQRMRCLLPQCKYFIRLLIVKSSGGTLLSEGKRLMRVSLKGYSGSPLFPGILFESWLLHVELYLDAIWEVAYQSWTKVFEVVIQIPSQSLSDMLTFVTTFFELPFFKSSRYGKKSSERGRKRARERIWFLGLHARESREVLIWGTFFPRDSLKIWIDVDVAVYFYLEVFVGIDNRVSKKIFEVLGLWVSLVSDDEDSRFF